MTTATAIVLIVGGTSSCAARVPVRSDYGIPRCPSGAAERLLSAEVLQCWFEAPHGRWRTLSHESLYDVLVVHVETLDTRDAEDIARRFVAGESRTFSEILLYAQPEAPTGPSRIRRVRWTRETGFEVLEFDALSRAPPSQRTAIGATVEPVPPSILRGCSTRANS